MGRILVVEDDAALRGLVAEVLTGEGYVVFEAADAEEAAEVLRESESVQLVLADLWLGSGPAAEVGVSYLRGVGAPVVVMSADAAAGSLAEGLGAVALITKPFDLERLIRVVDDVVGPGARS